MQNNQYEGIGTSPLTGGLLPQRVQLGHEDWVIHLPEEPLQHVRHVLDEVVPDAQLHIAGVFAELVHQKLDPGFGAVLPVDSLVAKAYRCTHITEDPLEHHWIPLSSPHVQASMWRCSCREQQQLFARLECLMDCWFGILFLNVRQRLSFTMTR